MFASLDRRAAALSLLGARSSRAVIPPELQAELLALRTDVRVRLGHEDQAMVIGDADLLKQLLFNLVENAVKYSPAGGEVRVALRRERETACVSVSDQGIGIAREDLGRLFRPFSRLKDGKASGIEGYGLSIIEQVPLFIDANEENRDYLTAKATRLGHQMDLGQGA